uniref:C-type lectin domain-containing protein n=1 Tax=Branchiostoma floridae TaxID=7739 RepID=C3XPN9_BRAFL|eukprot:XP_002613901.1 hypothetical protein BRAFLDRAFT_208611 [Branchiostoma floridae]
MIVVNVHFFLVSCPKGYSNLRGACYKAFNTLVNFGDAILHCRLDGGTLAMPRDRATNEFLISLKNHVNPNARFWIGLHDQRREGHFEWMDGVALGRYKPWDSHQPDDAKGKEDCVQYFMYTESRFGANKWNDADCNDPFPFICQVAADA